MRQKCLPTLSGIPGPAALASPEPHPKATESASACEKDPRVICKDTEVWDAVVVWFKASGLQLEGPFHVFVPLISYVALYKLLLFPPLVSRDESMLNT